MKILIIAAHPDDETLGAGGTLLKHKAKGDQIFWLIVTSITSKQGFTKSRMNERKKEISKVSKRYGFDKVLSLNFPTTTLDNIPLYDLIAKISGVFNEIKPEIIYTMNRSDAHSDHRVIFEAVAACTKSFRYPFIKRVLMYECISETEFAPALTERIFIPNYFVDITGYLDKKADILKIYTSELGRHPFPRSIENVKALATLRGATAGCTYAEAFQLVKFIDE